MYAKLKTRDPSFPGGPESHNVVVTAQHGTFSPSDRRKLDFLGLARTDGDGFEVEVWSQYPAIGPRPLYLAALLKFHFPAIRVNKDFSGELNKALSHPALSGLRDNTVPHPFDTAAGERDLVCEAGKSCFYVNCDLSDVDRQELLEGAGWQPYRGNDGRVYQLFGSQPYIAVDAFIAGNLEPFMTARAKERLLSLRQVSKSMIRVSKAQDRPDNFSVPAPEGEDYLGFQAAGIDYSLKSGDSLLIGDEMGLGKTITAIGILNGRGGRQKAVVFCEANMRVTWGEKLFEWLAVPHTIGIATGSEFPDTDIVIINYDIVSNHEEALRAIDWDVQIFDEAHRLKTPDTIRTRCLLGNVCADVDDEDAGPIPLAAGGQRVMLTGTPMPNRVTEIFPLASTLRPDVWGRGKEAYNAFVSRYAPPFLTKKGNKILALPGKKERFETELQYRLRSTFMVRRLKRDTDLPPKMRQPLYLDIALSDEDRAMLRQAEADLAAIRARHQVEVDAGDATVAGPVIDMIEGINENSEEFHTIARIRRNIGMLKAPWVAEHLVAEMKADDEAGVLSKTIVFAHHADVIDLIVERLRRDYPNGVVVYDGRTGKTAREDARERFQNDDEVRFFVGSSAAHTGITLTRSARVRFGEIDWSPSAMVQAEDRAWRIGQEKSVLVGYFMIPGTLDSTISQSLVRKMKAIEKNLNTTEINDEGYRAVDNPSVQTLAPARSAPPAPAPLLDVPENIPDGLGTPLNDDREQHDFDHHTSAADDSRSSDDVTSGADQPGPNTSSQVAPSDAPADGVASLDRHHSLKGDGLGNAATDTSEEFGALVDGLDTSQMADEASSADLNTPVDGGPDQDASDPGSGLEVETEAAVSAKPEAIDVAHAREDHRDENEPRQDQKEVSGDSQEAADEGDATKPSVEPGPTSPSERGSDKTYSKEEVHAASPAIDQTDVEKVNSPPAAPLPSSEGSSFDRPGVSVDCTKDGSTRDADAGMIVCQGGILPADETSKKADGVDERAEAGGGRDGVAGKPVTSDSDKAAVSAGSTGTQHSKKKPAKRKKSENKELEDAQLSLF